MDQTIKKPTLEGNLIDLTKAADVIKQLTTGVVRLHTAEEKKLYNDLLDDLIEIVKNVKIAYNDVTPTVNSGIQGNQY